jgi:hypothetical protein
MKMIKNEREKRRSPTNHPTKNHLLIIIKFF